MGNEHSEVEDEEEEVVESVVDPVTGTQVASPTRVKSPRSKSPNSPKRRNVNAAIDNEEAKRAAEEAQKAVQQMIETMQTTMTSNFEEVRKQIDDQKYDIKKITNEIDELKKKSEAAGSAVNMGMTGDLGESAGNGKISKAQQAFNSMVEERIS